MVPAWPMGKVINSTRPQYFVRAAMREEYFSVFSTLLLSQSRSMQNLVSTRMRVHRLLLYEGMSREGESGSSLAYMRFGNVS